MSTLSLGMLFPQKCPKASTDFLLSDRDELDKLMTSSRIGAYVGVDPTAPSIHLGHLLPLMALLWMYVEGFQAITVVSQSLHRSLHQRY